MSTATKFIFSDRAFIDLVDAIMARAHRNSREKGFWTLEINGVKVPYEACIKDPTYLASKIALIHSEASEMLEDLRKPGPDKHLPHRPNGEVEWADQLIRLFDYGAALGYDPATIIEKMSINEGRPMMHGDKKL